MALILAPRDGTIAALAGTILEWAGENQEATEAYANAVRLDATLSQSAFWASTPERRKMRDAVVEASGLSACGVGRVAVIYGTFEDDLADLTHNCQSLVTANPGSTTDRAALALLLNSLGRVSDAMEEAERAVHGAPDNAAARTALGIILSSQVEIAPVRRELLIGSYLEGADARLLLALTYEPLGPSHPLSANLGLLTRSELLPMPVQERIMMATLLENETAPGQWIFRHELGEKYYLVELLREAPTTLLIPGEWLEFSSPRTSLALELLRLE